MSNRVQVEAESPDFSLTDFGGNPVRLSDFRGLRHVLVVFNRGFF